ncbi:LysR family transcriptional regulator [Guyparkeria sp. SB14A]|uniref:LysR family transcriptional regulator n=1 Tax=Guyparkeria sp. SB14A TaxID=2571147 RepID=UPI0010ACF5B7|nr:LysR family transcriptional regulator [Guyparkeria sp. SB14A]TKA91205.1 LysR family transcriptional regulator [Guyparkeria sp. SB14A]
MNPLHLDTQQLLTFLAVAETGSFSSAALRLHISQPAVSKRLAQLEDRLGFALFDRMGQRVVLTYRGEQLLPAVREMQSCLDDIFTAAEVSGEALGGRLALSLSHYAGLHLLPGVLERFSERYPQVLLDLSFHDSERAIDQVATGETALAYATLPPRLDDRVRTRVLWEEVMQPVVARRHCPGGMPAGLEAIGKRLPLILPAEATSTRTAIDRWLDDRQLLPPAIIEINQLDSIAVLAATGVGWAVLPPTLLRDDLVRLDLGDPGGNGDDRLPHRRLGEITPLGRAPHPLAEAFSELVDAAATLQGPAENVAD